MGLVPEDFLLFFELSISLPSQLQQALLYVEKKAGGSGTLSALVLFPAEVSVVIGLIVGDVAKDSSVMKAILPLSPCYSPSSSLPFHWSSSLAALPLIPFAMKLPSH